MESINFIDQKKTGEMRKTARQKFHLRVKLAHNRINSVEMPIPPTGVGMAKCHGEAGDG